MEEGINIDSIVNWLTEVVEKKQQISPSAWLEAAARANVLLGNETDQMAELHQSLSKSRLEMMEAGATASKAKIASEATDEFKKYQKIKAKISRVEELIRLAKIMARLKDNEFRNSNFNQ